MKVEIITEILKLEVYGFSGTASERDYSGTAFKLMNKMWQIIKSNGLGNKGKNIWIYEKDHAVFAGIELNNIPEDKTLLEYKQITFTKYACYKHIGPYSLLKQAYQTMKEETKTKGFEAILPHVEIYGHWTNDESKLETELLMCLK